MSFTSNLTLEQRFDKITYLGVTYAPFSWGAPRVLFSIDRTVFQKSPKERKLLAKLKKKWLQTKREAKKTI